MLGAAAAAVTWVKGHETKKKKKENRMQMLCSSMLSCDMWDGALLNKFTASMSREKT